MKLPRLGLLIGHVAPVLFVVLFAAPVRAQLTNYSIVHGFHRGNVRGALPYSGLCEGVDGALYGMTSEGGRYNSGTLFRLNKSGSGFSVLHDFGASAGDGRYPRDSLIEGNDGNLYGTTRGGGATNWGTVFRIAKNGSAYQVLHSFTGTASDGAAPTIGLLEGSDGRLYGACGILGAGIVGTIFRMDKDGSNYAVIRQFQGQTYDFRGAIVEGTNGMLYGATLYGGDYGPGVVFRLNKDGSGYGIVRHFGAYFADGQYPSGGLVLANNGLLYGHTSLGGPVNGGITYVVGHDGTYSGSVHSYTSTSGKNPISAPIEGQDGYLYGTTDRGGTNDSGCVFRMKQDTTGYSVLHQFNYRTGDGVRAFGGVIQASDGLLYGTTSEGGRANKGTIYRLQTNGIGYEVLVHFDAEGAEPTPPIGSLVEAADGRLYGAANDGGEFFKGVLFSMKTDGSDFTQLHSFAPPHDIYNPARIHLISSPGVWLYGTTVYGGISNAGSIFSIGPNGTEYAVLHHFTYERTNGALPGKTLLQGSDGLLYGSTSSGGSNGYGILFRIATNGSGFTAMRSFTSSNDVRSPSVLIDGSDGFLYGVGRTATSSTTSAVIKLNRDGNTAATLAYLNNGKVQGDLQELRTTLMEARDGFLYGSANGGGTTSGGYLFKLSKDGSSYEVIHNFLRAPADGAQPLATLVEGHDGALYGTTYNGGAFDAGTLYKINKDGSGYAILRMFPAGGEGGYHPELPLIVSSDGAFYGVAPGRSADPVDLRDTAGFIFRLGHAASLRLTQGVPTIRATGVPDYSYALERSNDLSEWSVVETFVLPAKGETEFSDRDASPLKSFYRLRVR
jgi:uncharacterized repeat protein (TIGR03803 family)